MDAVAAAERFLGDNGRDIDRAVFDHHFGNMPSADMLGVLARYQNSDGGFGHGLEPDIQAPDSNPFATELALLICLQAGVSTDHPLLGRTVRYLEGTQDEDGGWRFSPAVYEHPLAPWFAAWEWPSLNPACTTSGLLRELGLGSERLHARVEALFEQMADPDDLLEGDFYAVRPYAYYFLPEWPHPLRELYVSGVLWWLIRQHARGELADAAHFFAYVRNPDTYTGRLMPERILTEELDRLQAEQSEDGGWVSPYDPHWRGWTTVQNLLVLRRFGRV